ncbi:2-hydroxyacid dehydrogenase [Compostimonas suwonensis]|uniref:D-3-phosphoglycerate dehydrogenase n=1 Tax=Compostimonas suwonensis TaxID=1048394 RepID=A0A2M9BWV4_9MICO|nr:NAD(P)-dependent oxidoreductase [Compostimonas suwonensis]PJJ62410.1 D-3-phosphoglycerate dehydrogenase [Compostimonas suwonensis]
MKILILQPLPDSSVAWLRNAGADVVLGYEDDSWRQEGAGIAGLLYYTVPVDKATLDLLPDLRVIGKRGVGIDSVDLDELERRGIALTNVAGVNSNSVAEHAITMLFAATRDIPVRDELTRAGRFEERVTLPLVQEVSGSRIAVVGAGNIGRRIAAILSEGFQCEIRFYDPYVPADVRATLPYEFDDDLLALFEWANNAVIAAPLTAETRDMVRREHLRSLGRKGVLTIISRGGVVNEGDLVEALLEKEIAAAGVDVYDHEPPAPDHPFFAIENVVLTPHTAGGSETSREKSSLLVSQQVWDHLHGRQVPLVAIPVRPSAKEAAR